MNQDATPAPATTPVAVRVRVWDLPTRLAHWLFAALIPVSWWTADTGRLEWHRWSGYALLGLLLFRIYWGFAGSSTARFARFVRGPRAIVSYLRGAWTVVPGHNPLGALSVLLLLGLLLLQIALGLFAVDVDGIESGPLSEFVDFKLGRFAAGWHETVFNLLLAVIALHVLAVLYYLWVRKQNLVGAMVSGQRRFDTAVSSLEPASVWRLIAGIALSAACTWAIATAFRFG